MRGRRWTDPGPPEPEFLVFLDILHAGVRVTSPENTPLGAEAVGGARRVRRHPEWLTQGQARGNHAAAPRGGGELSASTVMAPSPPSAETWPWHRPGWYAQGTVSLSLFLNILSTTSPAIALRG